MELQKHTMLWATCFASGLVLGRWERNGPAYPAVSFGAALGWPSAQAIWG